MKPAIQRLLLLAALAVWQPSHAMCFKEAAERYKVSETLLRAIAKTESNFNPRASNKNSDKSDDIGVMQINSSWLPVLAPYGIGRKELADPCINVNVGAWVLAHNIASHGDTWKAVGAYNAKSPIKQEIYVRKVYTNFVQVLKTNGSTS